MSRYDRDMLDQLDIALEDDAPAEFGTETQSSATSRYFVADHHVVHTIHEMRELMRATADLLEIEAARLRHELELLDLNADHVTLH